MVSWHLRLVSLTVGLSLFPSVALRGARPVHRRDLSFLAPFAASGKQRTRTLHPRTVELQPRPLFFSLGRAPFSVTRVGSQAQELEMAQPVVIFVLGGPGAGKGTQCGFLEEHFGFKHISAGDCLREERANEGSEFGELIDNFIKEGKIVPVEITVKLLKKKMEAFGWEGGRFLIDGFPRNKDNLDGWASLMGDICDDKFCLFFDCAEDVMETRLLERGKDSGRTDDNVESIRKRFRTYQTETMPIIQHFESLDKLRKIDANPPKDTVWTAVKALFVKEEFKPQETLPV
uniref:UMP-CMP kinase n=1 Tax=Chromera velia CCMP2878 TaxID=1169474 RepID=A0A0G4I749_9ALVE|eukprot:Cvel_11583.t1-p1 / transcript=Cvel_11583.t1 / gene=Cvel_11583 / organism=Chromera_velia_CCMP2878 / gene_product=UMP-CMP kinase, putative / transcript_product=UMP-CMP kinase, putative / location=Cvel_scaffold732:47946-51039(-) / protein_length=288 / sequence_SO=supercontig / SO=protein_coding / is_pseudo=false